MRQLGYNVIYFVQLIRFFGFMEGLGLFLKIITAGKSSVVSIHSKKFMNPVQIRATDLPIFYQVFCELQYDMNFYLHYKPLNIIDAGSNVGYSCLYFASVFPDASIVGIEPETRNFKQLQFNTSNYKNIKLIQAGIWHQNAFISIKDEDESSASFEVQETKEAEAGGLRGITIDSISEENNFKTIDILKLDIEGAEFNLFSNNPHTWLSRTRCIIIELHDLVQPGTSQVFFQEMAKYNWNTFIKGENIISFKA
jgi:FkbM family methyltransferase